MYGEQQRKSLKVSATALTLLKMKFNTLYDPSGVMDGLLLKAEKEGVLTYSQHTFSGQVNRWTPIDIDLAQTTRERLNSLGDIRALTAETFDADASDAFVVLWTLVLLYGTEEGDYGSSSTTGSNFEFYHLTSCGLNHTKSTTPDDKQWNVWQGTFAEDEPRGGLVGMATCRCGEVDYYEASMSYDTGIASLIVMASNLRGSLMV